MSVLSDKRLIELIADGELKLVPFVLDNIQPSSIDLRLDFLVKIQKNEGLLDVTQDNASFFVEHRIENEYIINPNQMILGQTLEFFAIPKNCNATIHNRSSLARLGLDVGLASYINPGYEGHLPLIIKNIGSLPIRLFPKIRICQMEISEVKPFPERDYSQRKDAKYFGEMDSLVSKIHLDKEINSFKNEKDNGISFADFLSNMIKQKSEQAVNSMPDELKKELGLL